MTSVTQDKTKKEIGVADIRPKNVHQSIERMTELLAEKGITKDKGGNGEIKYKFRGIDDIRNHIAPLQKECALVIKPSVIKRTETERQTKSGGFALWVVLEMQFEFINTIDGSTTISTWSSEAVDYSDKSTQKAQSQAYKTMCINIFNIPTEGEQDSDNEAMQFRMKENGAFESDEARKLWIANCKDAMERAETLALLVDIEKLYHDKLVIMRNSPNDADKTGASDIAALYKSKSEVLKPKGKL